MPIDLDLLMRAYANGIFPMSDARDDPDTFWIEPERRAILPLDEFRLSKSLAKTIRQTALSSHRRHRVRQRLSQPAPPNTR